MVWRREFGERVAIRGEGDLGRIMSISEVL